MGLEAIFAWIALLFVVAGALRSGLLLVHESRRRTRPRLIHPYREHSRSAHPMRRFHLQPQLPRDPRHIEPGAAEPASHSHPPATNSPQPPACTGTPFPAVARESSGSERHPTSITTRAQTPYRTPTALPESSAPQPTNESKPAANPIAIHSHIPPAKDAAAAKLPRVSI